MSITTRLNDLEEKVSNISKPSLLMWVCMCGETPCVCSEEHKRGKCKKYPSGSCAKCKSSDTWRFMSEKDSLPTPIVPKEELPALLEDVKKGKRDFPIPILGGLSAE